MPEGIRGRDASAVALSTLIALGSIKKTGDWENDSLWFQYFPNHLRLRAVYGYALEFTDSRQIPDAMWESVFWELHRESDLLGFSYSEVRNGYRVEVLKSFINDTPRAEEIFNEYLANLR